MFHLSYYHKIVIWFMYNKSNKCSSRHALQYMHYNWYKCSLSLAIVTSTGYILSILSLDWNCFCLWIGYTDSNIYLFLTNCNLALCSLQRAWLGFVQVTSSGISDSEIRAIHFAVLLVCFAFPDFAFIYYGSLSVFLESICVRIYTLKLI